MFSIRLSSLPLLAAFLVGLGPLGAASASAQIVTSVSPLPGGVVAIKPKPIQPCRIIPGVIQVPCQYKKLQNAINAANPGDKVLVDPGAYRGRNNKNLLINKTITLECKGVPGSCAIDAEGNGRAITLAGLFGGNNSLIKGFMLVGGKTNSSISPTNQGGAVYSSNSTATFDQCIFLNNEADGFNSSGGAYSGFGSADTISNSLITGNVADFGSAVNMSGGGNLTVRNTTISANVAGGNFNAAVLATQSALQTGITLLNTIVWGNVPSQNEIINNSGFVTATYTIMPPDVLPNFPGAGNTDQDPEFVNPAFGDYRIDPNAFPPSPAIDGGDPNYVTQSGERDLDDSCRDVCLAVDIGAYELDQCVLFEQFSPTDTPLVIPDPGTAISSLFVSGFGTIELEGIFVDIFHPSLGQLKVTLVHPDGTEDVLCNGSCNSPVYYVTTDFAGKDIHGTWQLKVQDLVTGTSGTLEDWRLDLEYSLPGCPL